MRCSWSATIAIEKIWLGVHAKTTETCGDQEQNGNGSQHQRRALYGIYLHTVVYARLQHIYTVACHVVKVFAVWFLERAHREADLVDPLLATAFETKDSIVEVYAIALTQAPELRFRCVDLHRRVKRNNPHPVRYRTNMRRCYTSRARS